MSDARKLKGLEDENRKLKRPLAESMLDVSTLKEMLGEKLLMPNLRERAVTWAISEKNYSQRQDRNLRWSLDFVLDTLVDDFTRECLTLVVDTSLTNLRVVREFNCVIETRGCPRMIVSDNGAEFTSNAIFTSDTHHPVGRNSSISIISSNRLMEIKHWVEGSRVPIEVAGCWCGIERHVFHHAKAHRHV